jgi:xylan 1,4-beta-xylosidase
MQRRVIAPPSSAVSLLALGFGLASHAWGADAATPVTFTGFEYTGHDTTSATPPGPGWFRNPILPGFYPDPSLCRVGDDFYLVTSSFCYFPGIPVFHSRDLVHWTQLGHVITRPGQANFEGLGVSRGVFAPALSYHDGAFYLVTTLVDCGGNCLFTAQNPAGPWSDPIWLKYDGIDPSLFFDGDGRAWIVSNGPPEGKPRYEGHRAIWLQEFDVAARKLAGPRTLIVNGGTNLRRHPVWIEAPHLFRRGGFHYLICAEGGTAEDHSEVVFRSRDVHGPWEPFAGNPILTQRDMPPGRPDPITCTGHADFVETSGGEWWAAFLGCRPYEDSLYNTGRETFLLPVRWQDDWPLILPAGQRVPVIVPGPKLAPADLNSIPLTGSFTWRDRFDRPTLNPDWVFLRTPHETWWSLQAEPAAIRLEPRAASFSGTGNPSFIGRRLQHANFTASAYLLPPLGEGVSAGLVAFQNETHYFFLAVRRRAYGVEIFLERAGGGAPQTITTASLAGPAPAPMALRITGQGRSYSFTYAAAGTSPWMTLRPAEDGSILSTKVAGGFVGTMLGLHARLERAP